LTESIHLRLQLCFGRRTRLSSLFAGLLELFDVVVPTVLFVIIDTIPTFRFGLTDALSNLSLSLKSFVEVKLSSRCILFLLFGLEIHFSVYMMFGSPVVCNH
jgi:hypothetical protein